MMELKSLRKEKKLTQQQAASYTGISLRSYKDYENNEGKKRTLKYNYLVDKLLEMNPIDEEHGILDLEDIILKCRKVLEKYKVEYCYLFGSYAKGQAKPSSDVDLLVSSNIKGIHFYGLAEELRESLHKKVDVLDIGQLKGNLELTQEILRDGIKIYG